MKKIGCMSSFFLLFFTFIATIVFLFMDNLILNEDNIATFDSVAELEGEPFIVNGNFEPTDTKPNYLQEEGVHSLIGQSVEEVMAKYGDPNRIDLSSYDYEWWIYLDAYKEGYLQVGIEKGVVVMVYCIGENLPTAPFEIGKTYQELNSIFKFQNQVPLKVKNNFYEFRLTKEDLESRPIIEVDGVYIQLYFDTFTSKLSSIRYLDAITLIKHRPYSIVYRGELIEPEEISAKEWRKVEKGSALQIFHITNQIRKRHHLHELVWDEETSHVAFLHSEDMENNEYFSHTSPSFGELKDRLKKENILFQLAGENIAAKYVDAIAAVEGWLNSEGHRVNLLHEEFTHLGVGVYERYYTQNFITPW
jgi:uncharacterized protein YkwD